MEKFTNKFITCHFLKLPCFECKVLGVSGTTGGQKVCPYGFSEQV